ncbi:MAG: type II and III secretion system protein family protein [Ramlibacter sp.]|nr:type II and III secretion system protein family protein [Ramlibacter sp.]
MHFQSRNAALAAALICNASLAAAQASTAATATAAPAQPTVVAQGAASTLAAPRQTPASTMRSPDRATTSSAGTVSGRPCTSVTVDPPTYLTLGKSRVVRLNFPATRIVVGGSMGSRAGRPVNLTPTAPLPGQPVPAGMPPAAHATGGASDGVADTEITLLGPNELFFLGRKTGSMNVVLQGSDGRCVVKDIVVTIDPATLQSSIVSMMPGESGVKVHSAENSIVLTGVVSDAVKLDQILSLANSYGDSKKLVNLLRVSAPQQVMLEVKIAEVSKTLLDRLGSSVNLRNSASGGLNTYSLISDFLTNGGGLVQALRIGRGSLGLDGQKDDGLVRVLAEPNIMAISGQPASFLSGGKIFIPVAQTPTLSLNGGTTITLEEKEFGVGLKFTPTVLDGRVNLKVVSEVSELSQTGTPFSTISGTTAILPSMTTRRVDTTVQLGDGQSFVIAGLIKNNVTEALKRVPGLGEVPVMGALFRSTEFQSDQTELMFVVTPRLVRPLPAAPTLPTDNHSLPSRSDIMLMGRTEGAAPPLQMAPPAAARP